MREHSRCPERNWANRALLGAVTETPQLGGPWCLDYGPNGERYDV